MGGRTTTGPYDLDDVFNLIFELFGCGPGDCKCPGVEEMVDSRPEQLKTVLKACPKGEDGASMIEKGKSGTATNWTGQLTSKSSSSHASQNRSSAKGMMSSLRSLGSDVRTAASPNAKERTGTV